VPRRDPRAGASPLADAVPMPVGAGAWQAKDAPGSRLRTPPPLLSSGPQLLL